MGQVGIDSPFHGIGIDEPIVNADKSFGRNNDETVFEPQFVASFCMFEYLQQGEVRLYRGGACQVRQKRVTSKEIPAVSPMQFVLAGMSEDELLYDLFPGTRIAIHR